MPKRQLKLNVRVETSTPLSAEEIEGIRSALRGSRVKELGFGLAPAAEAAGPQAEILHDMIDMHHEHEHEHPTVV